MNSSLHSYWCILGNTPELSTWELTSLSPRFNWTITPVPRHPEFTHLSASSEIDADAFFDTVAGTVKLTKTVTSLPLASTAEEIVSAIVSFLTSLGKEKITFGVGEIGRDHLPPIEHYDIKRKLTEQGFKVSYKEDTRQGLSTAYLQTDRVTEVLVLQTPTEIVLTHTQGVQSLKGWTQRDRSKPYFDRKKGMLPPKVARMMVNIASGSATPISSQRLYDPFCGSGTVLLEAALSGFSVVGSDLDGDAIRGTRANINWLNEALNLAIDPVLVVGDVSGIHPTQLGAGKIDYIVTEPFLGKPTPLPQQLSNVFRGLHKLYLGAFKHWTQILKPGAQVVIVFPEVETPQGTFDCSSLIDKLENLGYTSTSTFVRYARPQAVVQRQIWKFTFQPKEK